MLEALLNRDGNALAYIKDLFLSAHLQPPYLIDTFGYYENISKELQKIDTSIAGIFIYWDEFTTVFDYAGRSNNAKILQKIQEWAQKAPSNIILFLVSHRSPEAFRGRYPSLNDELAKIEDRFMIANMKMEKYTTYELIENSIVIKDLEKYNQFLDKIGFNSKFLKTFSNRYKEIFGDIEYNEKN